MADVLALVDDLFFQSKLIETARGVGVTLKITGTGQALLAAAAAQEHKLVLIDLNARQGALEAVAQLRNASNSAGNAVCRCMTTWETGSAAMPILTPNNQTTRKSLTPRA